MRHTSCIASMMVLAWLTAGAQAMAGSVNVYVQVPVNLADTDEPMPELQVFNNGDLPIEFEAFHGVPLTFLETKKGDEFVRPAIAMCGNGYAPRRIEPGGWESFPLWSRIDHGPGLSGSYRVAFPHLVVKGKKKIEAEVITDPFDLEYGDVPPVGYEEGWIPGELVLEGATSEVVDDTKKQSHTPEQVFASMKPQMQKCVSDSQKEMPWIRGTFTLVAYSYPGQKKPVTFVDSSLLGDEALAKCIESIPMVAGYTGKAKLHLSVTHPLPPSP